MKTILYNANVITMEDEEIKQAIFIEDDIIKMVGSNEEILNKKDKDTKIVDVNGATILPGFIDSHSHFSAVANSFLQVKLDNCINFDDIKERITKYINDNNIKKSEWIIAEGYDNNNLIEKRHPKLDFLDTFSKDNPIVIKHKSGHMGVFNSKALEILKVSKDTIFEGGGVIEKINNKLTGYMEENAFVKHLKMVPMPSIEKLLLGYKKAQEKYLSYGITTIQEGYMSKELFPLYKELLKKDILKIDLIGYPDLDSINLFKNEFYNSYKKYDRNFKIQGIKMILDGSPQGKTAWMKTDYINDKGYRGYPSVKHEDVVNNISFAKENNLQILSHANGDMAAKEYINSCIEVGDIKMLRPVMIHAQLVDVNDLDDVKKIGLILSFFVAHVYYWGDVHIQNFGIKRASKISPVKSAIKNNIIYTLHQDSPIIEPNMLETIWCAVKRQTKDKTILGEDEKISVFEALKGITINSAYQYFEENKKGSIKKGKIADLVILDKNPLDVQIDKIQNIKVLKTIKNGKIVYEC